MVFIHLPSIMQVLAKDKMRATELLAGLTPQLSSSEKEKNFYQISSPLSVEVKEVENEVYAIFTRKMGTLHSLIRRRL